MMFTKPMVHMIAVVLDSDMEKVSKELLKQGVLHFVNINEVKRKWSSETIDVSPPVSQGRATEARKRIEGILRQVGIFPQIPPDIDIASYKTTDIEKIEKRLTEFEEKISEIREKQRLIQQEIMRLEDIKNQVAAYGLDKGDVKIAHAYSFISIRMGSIKKENVEKLSARLKEYPATILTRSETDGLLNLVIVYMKRNENEIDKILGALGWKDIEIGGKPGSLGVDLSEDIDNKLTKLYEQQAALSGEAESIIKKDSRQLTEMWVELRVTELLAKVQSYFKKTKRTVIFSGWVPADRRESLTVGIKSVVSGRCYIEWYLPKEVTGEAEGTTVPVELSNPKIFAPFQMLVTNYGIPEYGTIDPTPVVVVIYLVMFGLMFPDAGQGAVITILGIVGNLMFRGKKEGWRNLARLITWCVLSSIIGGLLVGAYFGMSWFKPLWFDFHGILSGHPDSQSAVSDIFDVLKLAIYFGIFVIELGLVFNWINLIVKRRWITLIFDKAGLTGGWIYNGGVYVAFYMVRHGYSKLPGMSDLFWLIGLPAVMLAFKEPLGRITENRDETKSPIKISGLMKYLMEWMVEILEVFSGYLSNTLSFLRVAGFGIAHVTLMIAFFELAGMASGGKGPPYSPAGIVVLVAGNILVIVLEGLSAGVQSLRLNYYEFFTKFFRGAGHLYSPVSLTVGGKK